MPALEIRIGYPGGELSMEPLMAIADTGADGTLIPQSLLDQIGAPIVDDTRIRSHWGDWRRVLVLTVDIGVGDALLPAVDVVGDDVGDEIIVGRNVLNKLRLLFDGLAQQVQVGNSSGWSG
jgi:predicted aspartyl protease